MNEQPWLAPDGSLAIVGNISRYDYAYASPAAFPGKEKCQPILESHLRQAAFVLEAMKAQSERKV